MLKKIIVSTIFLIQANLLSVWSSPNLHPNQSALITRQNAHVVAFDHIKTNFQGKLNPNTKITLINEAINAAQMKNGKINLLLLMQFINRKLQEINNTKPQVSNHSTMTETTFKLIQRAARALLPKWFQ